MDEHTPKAPDTDKAGFTPDWSDKPKMPLKPDIAAKVKAKEASGRPVLGPEHPKIRFLAMAFLILLALGAGFAGGWLGTHNQTDTTSANLQKQQVVLKTQGQLISKIAKDVGASVVSVNTTSTVTTQSFFGLSQPSTQEGAGTGIILTADGLIVTNRHVAPAGTTKVSVVLSDGTEFDDVKVIGRTNSTDSLDIAFLKINDLKGKKLTPASLGDSSKMEVGDSVIAIGNALGQFQNTVTSGILSGYGRSIVAGDASGGSTENLEGLFQTDAAINEGNSGGPLVNLDGEVVGINTAVAGDAQNIGFSIPINDVAGLIKSVEQNGKLERPYIGVVYVPITDDVAQQYNLSVTRGAYIPSADQVGQDPIISGGPADKAGLKSGDVITKIDDKTIDQTNSLSGLINKHNVGDKVTLTVIRDGKNKNIQVTLGAAPSDDNN
ncbi:MAG TPA: trypsin-like peptidase domain-containing protein [Candidatus Saccharimonadales bacterium]|nr:trypsin-like peptidase domain-containing protein [Candidatus Saccharimonadales bacterium]